MCFGLQAGVPHTVRSVRSLQVSQTVDVNYLRILIGWIGLEDHKCYNIFGEGNSFYKVILCWNNFPTVKVLIQCYSTLISVRPVESYTCGRVKRKKLCCSTVNFSRYTGPRLLSEVGCRPLLHSGSRNIECSLTQKGGSVPELSSGKGSTRKSILGPEPTVELTSEHSLEFYLVSLFGTGLRTGCPWLYYSCTTKLSDLIPPKQYVVLYYVFSCIAKETPQFSPSLWVLVDFTVPNWVV